MTKIVSHLQDHRRRTDLSQDEVAFLVGSPRGTDAARYERFIHEPTLRAAMALEVVFRTPLKELFSRMHEKVERGVVKRARKMLRRTPVEHLGHQKFEALIAIVDPPIEE